MATDESSYAYSPLSSDDSFRLLDLELEQPTKRIKGELFEFPVGQSPPYICLSYCWGVGNSNDFHVNIDGKRLAVSRGVYLALHNIRDWMLHHGDTTSVMVWVDQICINQEDLAERAVQVGHMKALYSQAKRVVVHLGAEENGSEKIPELYQILRSTALKFKNKDDTPISYDLKDLSMRELDGTGLPPRGDPLWEVNRLFLHRPWFLRTWIIQEAVLARDLFFICGGWGMDGIFLAACWDFIIGDNLIPMFSNPTPATAWQVVEGKAMHQILLMLDTGMGRDNKPSQSLIDMLQRSRNALATNPRDHVYGLLGLATEAYRERLTVDYEESVADLYARVARLVVELGEGHKLLYNLHGLHSDLSLPSWVPDWTSEGYPFFTLAPMQGNAVTTFDIPYVRAGGESSNMRVSQNGLSLHCDGFIVDVIDKVSSADINDYNQEKNEQTAEPGNGEDETAKRKIAGSYGFLQQCLSDMADFLQEKSAYPPKNHEEVIWRTAVWNRSRSGQKKADDQLGELYEACKGYLQLRSSSNREIRERYGPRMRMLDKELGFFVPIEVANKINMQERDRECDQGEKYANWATTISMQMKRCGTVKGYIGQVPKSTQAGDVVCVIGGAAVPFVLRAGSGGYKVVGQCYLHGIMEGEALRDPSLTKETITLV
ncbi:heterokaryon incompatibility protein-domain-containing protein [Apodospora peruviana]|uniref:Heterokaryon incompatibility protein-domain-containing protein n=1 Tax=Apodospora peruviana TaxID=516989 RepID=A0AAE0I6C0_9PEZI|nr:heterokaryon incompatibility protein-domain-containing protein [Apodospora peruviana]